MKKWISLALALVMILSLSACAEPRDPSTDDNSTAGTANNSTTTAPSATTSSTKTVICLTSYTITNKWGTRFKYEITYEADGVHTKPPLNTTVDGNVYDWDGKLLCVLGYNENGKITRRVDYTYDQHGKLTETLMTSSLNGFPPSRIRYAYDADGRLISESHDNADDKVSRTEIYSYDERGFLKEVLELDIEEDGSTTEWEKRIFTCDDSGKILTCARYLLSDSQRHFCTFVCTYDDQGRLISNVCNPESIANSYSPSRYYTYDDQGRLSRFKLTDGYTAAEKVYTYNNAGLLTYIADTATGETIALHYTPITLDADLALKAMAWALDGALKAFVENPEFIY